MRESENGEKTRLPRDSTEVWLDAQVPAPSEAKHKKPPEDIFEAWVSKRVHKKRASTRRKRSRKA